MLSPPFLFSLTAGANRVRVCRHRAKEGEIADHYDVIVAGAGIGGLCAALRARENGASVAILEKADQIGGSAAASGGTIWCASNIGEWLKVQPDGDVALGTALIDYFHVGIDWLIKQGVSLQARAEPICTN